MACFKVAASLALAVQFDGAVDRDTVPISDLDTRPKSRVVKARRPAREKILPLAALEVFFNLKRENCVGPVEGGGQQVVSV
jgi:hypothetical protein